MRIVAERRIEVRKTLVHPEDIRVHVAAGKGMAARKAAHFLQVHEIAVEISRPERFCHDGRFPVAPDKIPLRDIADPLRQKDRGKGEIFVLVLHVLR